MKVILNVLLLIIIVYTVDAQVIPKAPDGLRLKGINVVVFAFQWNTVIDADYYLVDVAEDSSFIKILRGMKDFPVQKPSGSLTFGEIAVFHILLEKPYYCRVRAVNNAGISPSSQTLKVFGKTTQPGYFLIRVDEISDTSITFIWPPSRQYKGDSVVKEYKQYSLSVDTQPVVIPSPLLDGTYRVEVSGLAPGKPHTVFFLQEVGVSNQTISPATTISREWAGIKKFVSYNEFRRAFVMPKTPTDSLKYYTMTTGSRTPTHHEMDSILTVLKKTGIPLDTVWFFEGGPWWEGLERIPNINVQAGLTIKLSKQDARMEKYGFRRGFGYSIYSNEFLYYRYDLSGTTGVEAEPKAGGGEILRIAPNPAGEAVMLYYTIADESEVRIEIVNSLGMRKIETTLIAVQKGSHTLPITVTTFPPGSYYVRLTARNKAGVVNVETKLLSIIR